MQEKLNIFNADGAIVRERDLETVKATLLVVLGPDGPEFAETSGADTRILAALVRDEDGWTIASSAPSVPVSCGPKAVTDMHLTPGIPCRIGDWVFRLEREVGEFGAVLVWRNEGSPVAVDAVLSGRNVVARVAGGTIQVNPVLSEGDLFEFFPTQDGLDVAIQGDTASRISVSPKTLFSVGRFEGMLMTVSEAAEAVRSGNAFAWPSRGLRTRLLLSALLLGAASLGGIWLTKQCQELELQLAQPRGAVRIEAMKDETGLVNDDDIVAYTFGFLTSLPTFHLPMPNLVTQDFIQRGEHLLPDPSVADMVSYLREIRQIKELVLAARWKELGSFVANVNRRRYVVYDGLKFYEDARELVGYVTEQFPQLVTRLSIIGSEDAFFRSGEALSAAQIEKDMETNLFMTDGMARREIARIIYRCDLIRTYVAARRKVLAGLADGEQSLDQETIDAYADAFAAIDNALPPEDQSYSTFMNRERKVAQDIAERGVKDILGDGNGLSPRYALLEQFAVLAAYVGLPEKQIAEWRSKAKAAAKAVDAKSRAVHSRYRIVVLTDRKKAIGILDELLAIGPTANRYYDWAVKEKARLESALKASEERK